MSQRSIVATMLLLATLAVAGIVHIASLLLIPRVAPNDVYARLAAFAPEGGVKVLPRATAPGDPVPERDPSVATAVCRYDLDNGPVRVLAPLGDQGFLALALHARSGVTFYGLTDRAGNDGKLEVVVMTAAQRLAAEARDSADSPVRDVRVVAPESLGYVTFDVLPRVGGYSRAEQDLASVSCQVERPI
ncbi:MAG: DUF1254 domain-containing protein [Janthinobacterium lividum]